MDDDTKPRGKIALGDLETMVAAMVEKGLDAKVVLRIDGKPYLAVRVGKSFHVFREVQAKQAAKNCGSAVEDRNTTEIWESDLWGKRSDRFQITTLDGIKLIYPDGREELVSE